MFVVNLSSQQGLIIIKNVLVLAYAGSGQSGSLFPHHGACLASLGPGKLGIKYNDKQYKVYKYSEAILKSEGGSVNFSAGNIALVSEPFNTRIHEQFHTKAWDKFSETRLALLDQEYWVDDLEKFA